jgi:hypothetical protein
MESYTLPDSCIERFGLSGSSIVPILSVLFQPLAATLVTFRVTFPAHRACRLCFGCELLEQPFNSLKSLIALNREMERPGIDCLMPRVEEGDHRSWLAEMAPSRLNCQALPSRFLNGHRRIAIFVETPGPALSWCRAPARRIGHVTAPSDAGRAPRAARRI